MAEGDADGNAWTEALLHAHVQDAVELELFTIPAYLCAYHSIDQAHSAAAAGAADALLVVVNQEMMHLEQVCNLSNALGCGPRLTGAAAPRYPGRVPHNRHDVEIALGPATRDQIQRFMAIELPTWRDPYALAPSLPPQDAYETIGAFYQALIHGLGVVYGPGGAEWPAGVNAQVVDNFTDDKTPITDLASATAAIQLIMRQGEGASQADPHDGDPRELAHYYQLQAILGALGPGDVRPMVRDTAGLPYGARCAALLGFFDACYAHVLRMLEASFNGQSQIGRAVGMMWAVINALAAYVVDVPYQAADADAPSAQTLTPRYRYTTVTPQAAYEALDAADRDGDAVRGVAEALQLTSA